jgi:hypothetical protein
MSTLARNRPLMRNSRARSGGPPTWLAAIVLALAIGVVYGRALNVPFILDDDSTILGNKSIASLWPPTGTAEDPGPLRPPVPLPTAGRPLVNLTFAIHRAPLACRLDAHCGTVRGVLSPTRDGFVNSCVGETLHQPTLKRHDWGRGNKRAWAQGQMPKNSRSALCGRARCYNHGIRRLDRLQAQSIREMPVPHGAVDEANRIVWPPNSEPF